MSSLCEVKAPNAPKLEHVNNTERVQRRPGRACSWPKMGPQEHGNRKGNSRERRLVVPSAESEFPEETNLHRRDLRFSAWVLGDGSFTLVYALPERDLRRPTANTRRCLRTHPLRTPRVTSTQNSIGCFPLATPQATGNVRPPPGLRESMGMEKTEIGVLLRRRRERAPLKTEHGW